MAATHCPHCRVALPDGNSVFCGSCGRRVEGWIKPPSDGTPPPGLTDGQAPTMKGELPPVAVARVAPSPPPSSSSAPTVKGTALPAPVDPLAVSSELVVPTNAGTRVAKIVVVAVAAGAVAAGSSYFLFRHFRAPPPAPRPAVVVNLDPPPSETAPIAPSKERAARKAARKAKPGAPPTLAPPSDGEAAAPAGKASSPAAARAPAPAVAPASPPSKAPAVAKPAAATPTRPSPAAAPAGSAAAAAPAPLTGEDEDAPPTPEELAEDNIVQSVKDNIRFVVQHHRQQIVSCYERAFKQEDTTPAGRVDIAFTVSAEGKAKKIATLTNSTGSEKLARCLESLLGEWQFPRPPDGDFPTSFPFVFSGG